MHKYSTSKKKSSSQKAALDGDGALVKRTPVYRLYSPSNPVLKEEYTVLSPEIYKRISSREEE